MLEPGWQIPARHSVVKGNTAEGKPEQWEGPWSVSSLHVSHCQMIWVGFLEEAKPKASQPRYKSGELQPAAGKESVGVMSKALSQPKSLGSLVRRLTYIHMGWVHFSACSF